MVHRSISIAYVQESKYEFYDKFCIMFQVDERNKICVRFGKLVMWAEELTFMQNTIKGFNEAEDNQRQVLGYI